MMLGHCELSGRSDHEAGRELLAALYQEATGEDLPPIAIAEKGKPYFAGSPWHFSISHTKHHVFCALSDRPVGLDAEEMDRKADLRLAERILSASEKRHFDAAADKQACLLRLWVLKEAQAKLTGEGLRIYPNHTNFSLEDSRVTQIDGCLVAVLEEGDDHAV